MGHKSYILVLNEYSNPNKRPLPCLFFYKKMKKTFVKGYKKYSLAEKRNLESWWRFCSKGERSTVRCSRKKSCKLCILDISETLFILPSFFNEQFWL